MLAPAEELRHLESVLELWDAVPDAAESIADRPGRRGDPGGRPPPAAPVSRLAPRRLPGPPSTPRTPEDVVRFTPAAAFFLIDDNHAEEALERSAAALALLEDRGPSVHRARVLAAHARSAVNSDQDDLARASAERAVAESRELGVPDAEADALATLAIVEVNDADTAAELLRQAMARAQDAGDLLTEVRIAHNLTSTLYYAGRLRRSGGGVPRRHRPGARHRRAVDGLRRQPSRVRRADPLRHRRSHAGPAVPGLGARLGGGDVVGRRPVCGGRARGRGCDRARSGRQGRLARGSDDGDDLRRLHDRRADLGRAVSGGAGH